MSSHTNATSIHATKRTHARSCTAIAFLALLGFADAQAGTSGNVSLTSDYVFRGISQTQEDPTFQASVDYAHISGFYAGIWGSGVDFTPEYTLPEDEDDADIEIDYYVGFGSDFNDTFGYDVSFVYYTYPGTADGVDYDYPELIGKLTGWGWIDPVVAVAIGAWVVPRTLGLGSRALRILLQAAPDGLDLDALRQDLGHITGVLDVHDLHVWTLTSEMEVASAHLVVGAGTDAHGVLDMARDVLQDRYGIAHATLQVEPDDHQGCADVTW